ncbi:Holliday junction branch migration protein RuvA [Candidatus Dependentiae bacterium]|nr:Holliday junction branch migration protein RuvA [Candidatus Dependentiae bacterium]
MISWLHGTVIESSAYALTVDVRGVGYSVTVVDYRLYSPGSTITLYIYFHWNQEQGPHLYGFNDLFSKDIFVAIISCSGCGPKIGLAILSHMKPQEFVQALIMADVKALSKVNGIGQKKAELIIMHLKDKIARFTPQVGVEEHLSLKKLTQVQGALEALHYKQSEISGALEYVHTNSDIEGSSFDELLRKALSFLAKRLSKK